MTAEELKARFGMEAHPENGAFSEQHYEELSGQRPASGSIYYYLAPGEKGLFHRIDCDEYWCHSRGSALTLCIIDEEGCVSQLRLGTEEGCEPFAYLKKGCVFAARCDQGKSEGAFLVCITVPRFQYEGFEVFQDREILAVYPEAARFLCGGQDR